MSEIQVGDRVRIVSDKLKASGQVKKAVRGEVGTVGLVLGDGLLVVDIGNHSTSCWPSEVEFVR